MTVHKTSRVRENEQDAENERRALRFLKMKM
jgi:hypothetical protein